MNPETGRIAFQLAFFPAFISGILFFFLNRDSASYIANTLAFTLSLIFLLIIIWDVRRQARST